MDKIDDTKEVNGGTIYVMYSPTWEQIVACGLQDLIVEVEHHTWPAHDWYYIMENGAKKKISLESMLLYVRERLGPEDSRFKELYKYILHKW